MYTDMDLTIHAMNAEGVLMSAVEEVEVGDVSVITANLAFCMLQIAR